VEAGYSDWGFSYYSSVSSGKSWDSTLKCAMTAPSYILTNLSFTLSYHMMLYNLYSWGSVIKTLRKRKYFKVLMLDVIFPHILFMLLWMLFICRPQQRCHS
jgi:hypothetical protein